MADATARDTKVSEKNQAPKGTVSDAAAALTDKEAAAVKGGLSDIVVTKTTDTASTRL